MIRSRPASANFSERLRLWSALKVSARTVYAGREVNTISQRDPIGGSRKVSNKHNAIIEWTRKTVTSEATLSPKSVRRPVIRVSSPVGEIRDWNPNRNCCWSCWRGMRFSATSLEIRKTLITTQIWICAWRDLNSKCQSLAFQVYPASHASGVWNQCRRMFCC